MRFVGQDEGILFQFVCAVYVTIGTRFEQDEGRPLVLATRIEKSNGSQLDEDKHKAPHPLNPAPCPYKRGDASVLT